MGQRTCGTAGPQTQQPVRNPVLTADRRPEMVAHEGYPNMLLQPPCRAAASACPAALQGTAHVHRANQKVHQFLPCHGTRHPNTQTPVLRFDTLKNRNPQPPSHGMHVKGRRPSKNVAHSFLGNAGYGYCMVAKHIPWCMRASVKATMTPYSCYAAQHGEHIIKAESRQFATVLFATSVL